MLVYVASELFSYWPLFLPLALLGGIAGGSTGFGLYLIIGPALWVIFTPTESIAFAFAISIPGYYLLFYLRSFIIWPLAAKIMLFAIPGLLLGFLLHIFLPDHILKMGAGIIIIALLAVRTLISKKITPYLGGSFAGVLSSSVGFNGPPVALSFHGEDERKQRGSTLAVLALLSLVVGAIFLLLDSSREEFARGWMAGLVLIPPVSLGFWIGHRLAGRLGSRIEYLALAISFLGALALLSQSLWYIL